MRMLTRSLLVVAAAAMFYGTMETASAQVRAGVNVRGDRAGFRLFGRRPWYADVGVRRQLKIDDDQYNTMNRNYVQYWTPYNQAVVGIPADATEQQRQQQYSTAYGTFNSGVTKANAQVFTDPTIRNRYNQLQLQYQGYGAFNDPEVQARLKLTDEQRQNFHRYYTDWNKQMNTYHDEYARDRAGVNKQFTGSWKQTRDRINETLTPEQRKSWNEMTGEAYDFPADAYFDDDADDRDNPRQERREERREDRRDNPPRNAPPAPAPAPAPANPR